MHLTRFTDYSLRVLIYLGQHNTDRVTINQISEAYDISKNHLMKVVSNLTRSKLVVAQRGPGGGIQLNRPPEEIILSEVISTTEKRLPRMGAHKKQNADPAEAESRLECYLYYAFEAYLQALARFSLADVLTPESGAAGLLGLEEEAA